MHIFLFFSERDTRVFGLTADPEGGNLPFDLGPWSKSGDGEALYTDPGEGLAGFKASNPVMAAIKHDGFYLGRTSKATRLSVPVPVPAPGDRFNGHCTFSSAGDTIGNISGFERAAAAANANVATPTDTCGSEAARTPERFGLTPERFGLARGVPPDGLLSQARRAIATSREQICHAKAQTIHLRSASASIRSTLSASRVVLASTGS